MRLGSYEIVAPLGAGGVGQVYRARDVRLSGEVALKLLPEAFAADPKAVERLAEAEYAVKDFSSISSNSRFRRLRSPVCYGCAGEARQGVHVARNRIRGS
jgi:serine/threonine protein kinase